MDSKQLPLQDKEHASAALKQSIRLRQRRYFHIMNSSADGYQNISWDPTRTGVGQSRWDSLYSSWSQPLEVLRKRQIPVRTSSIILPEIPRTLGFQHDCIFSATRIDRSSIASLPRSMDTRTAGIRSIPWNYHCCGP